MAGEVKLPEFCHCGKKMHLSPSQVLLIKFLGSGWGEFKKIQILGGKAYQVPTYYIVLHGLKVQELPKLGFPEIGS